MPHPNYVSDSDFENDRYNRMVAMDNRRNPVEAEIFPDGDLHPEQIRQSSDGSCFMLGTLIPLAKKNPNFIRNLFTDNGDGTVTVNFAEPVTIDKTLPQKDQDCPSWVGLLEKAFIADRKSLNYKLSSDQRSKIDMRNLDWGDCSAFMDLFSKEKDRITDNATNKLSECRTRTEAAGELKKMLDEADQHHASVVIDTPSHNMAVEGHDEKGIQYYDQLRNTHHTVSYDDLLSGNTNIDFLEFFYQGKGNTQASQKIFPKTVAQNLTEWSRPEAADQKIKDSTRDLLNHIDKTLGIDESLAGIGADKVKNDFLAGKDSRFSTLLKNHHCEHDMHAFHKQFRTDEKFRQEIAENYRLALQDYPAPEGLEEYTQQIMQEVSQKFDDLRNHPERLRQKGEPPQNWIRNFEDPEPDLGTWKNPAVKKAAHDPAKPQMHPDRPQDSAKSQQQTAKPLQHTVGPQSSTKPQQPTETQPANTQPSEGKTAPAQTKSSGQEQPKLHFDKRDVFDGTGSEEAKNLSITLKAYDRNGVTEKELFNSSWNFLRNESEEPTSKEGKDRVSAAAEIMAKSGTKLLKDLLSLGMENGQQERPFTEKIQMECLRNHEFRQKIADDCRELLMAGSQAAAELFLFSCRSENMAPGKNGPLTGKITIRSKNEKTAQNAIATFRMSLPDLLKDPSGNPMKMSDYLTATDDKKVTRMDRMYDKGFPGKESGPKRLHVSISVRNNSVNNKSTGNKSADSKSVRDIHI